MLQKVLPDELFARIQEVQVDPFRLAPESDILPIINGDTGDEVARVSLPKFHRCSTVEMRKLFAEGLTVEVSSQSIRLRCPKLLTIKGSKNVSSISSRSRNLIK